MKRLIEVPNLEGPPSIKDIGDKYPMVSERIGSAPYRKPYPDEPDAVILTNQELDEFEAMTREQRDRLPPERLELLECQLDDRNWECYDDVDTARTLLEDAEAAVERAAQSLDELLRKVDEQKRIDAYVAQAVSTCAKA